MTLAPKLRFGTTWLYCFPLPPVLELLLPAHQVSTSTLLNSLSEAWVLLLQGSELFPFWVLTPPTALPVTVSLSSLSLPNPRQ